MIAPCQTERTQEFAHYTLHEKLEEGSVGLVYRALDRNLGKPVAIRILGQGIRWDAALRDCFARECALHASVHHPNIAALLEFGQDGESPFIATEYLEGSDLRRLIERKSGMPIEQKLRAMIQVADGLNHAHENGLLHCDLKPSKIHLLKDGTVKTRDFGVSRLLMRNLIHPGVRWGSAIYLSPEQISGGNCDRRSDMFSAGMVLYELLSGTHPFHDPNSNRAVDKILFETSLPTLDEHPGIPSGLWPILNRSMAKNPADRYQNMREFADDLDALLQDMTKECQLMLSELLAALPRLRVAAQLPDSPQSTIRFLWEVESLLDGRQSRDYALLDRLMGTLLEQYPTIQCVSGMREITEPPPPPGATVQESAPPEKPIVEDSTSHPPDARETAAAVPEDLETGDHCIETLPLPAAETQALPQAPEIPAPRVEDTPPPVAEPVKELRPQTENWSVTLEDTVSRPVRPQYRRIPRRALRTTAALLALLLITVAGYILRMKNLNEPQPPPLSIGYAGNAAGGVSPQSPGSELAGVESSAQASTLKVLLAEAKSLSGQRRYDDSRLFLRRILELNPGYAPATELLQQIDAAIGSATPPESAKADLRTELAGVSSMISLGQLGPASAALDRLQRAYPGAPGVVALRRQWDLVNNRIAAEVKRKEDKAKDDERTRQVADLLAQGRYEEARGAINLWIADDPANPQAQGIRRQLDDVQRSLKAFETALAGNRYREALNALDSAQQMNPSDPTLARLRAQVESRMSAARASLSVHRLAGRATLLFDGKPIGSNGETDNEAVPIGSHTLAVADQQNILMTRTIEFTEGQRARLVYDSQNQVLRPMVEGDIDILARRKAAEETQHFLVEHSHGLLRGGCKGTLTINSQEIAYEPASGSHRFRMPLSHLNLGINGRSIDLANASDGKSFQSLRAEDIKTAESIKQAWNSLRSQEQQQAKK